MQMDVSTIDTGAVRFRFTSVAGAVANPDSGVVCTIAFSPALDPTHNATLSFTETTALGPRDEVVAVTATGADVVPVTLLDLAVNDEPAGARVHWQVADASIAAGYRVLRAGAGDAEPVHEGLLPAATTEFVDDTAVPASATATGSRRSGATARSPRSAPSKSCSPRAGCGRDSPYPNPARSGASLDVRAFATGDMRAAITDVTGRVVRELAGSAGASILHWDGRTAAGTEAPAGIYFLVLTQGAERELRRIVKLGG